MAMFPACSVAVFGSFFRTLRRMVSAGHEVMRDGDFGPFFDLTVPDSLYILPAVTAVTLFGVMEIEFVYPSILYSGAITVPTANVS